LDPLIYLPKYRLKEKFLKQSFNSVDLFIVWAPTIIHRYSEYFNIPRHKFKDCPFFNTIEGYDISYSINEYRVFSGGDSMRDYNTLFQAFDNLNIKMKIDTRLNIQSYNPYIDIASVTNNEFRDHMSSIPVHIYPLDMKHLRTSGQQSYLNSMALGKAVIVTDTEDASYYIKNGYNGLLTPSGDVTILRNKILDLLSNPEMITELGNNAKQYAVNMTQENTYTKVLAYAIETHGIKYQT